MFSSLDAPTHQSNFNPGIKFHNNSHLTMLRDYHGGGKKVRFDLPDEPQPGVSLSSAPSSVSEKTRAKKKPKISSSGISSRSRKSGSGDATRYEYVESRRFERSRNGEWTMTTSRKLKTWK